MLNKEERNTRYEQVVHDQALYSATEALELHRKLAYQTRQQDSLERRQKATEIKNRLSSHSAKCYTLSYMYDAVGRNDLQEMMLKLIVLNLTEATLAMADPEGWEKACSITGSSSHVDHKIPEHALREWRLEFLDALGN
nr:hypothetical protein [Moritella viscosa]SHO06816.1 Transcriptional regulator, SARP family [Moritella viscosa]